jgi:glycosyltransferase involved in cell wall biosynthesis
MNIAYLRRLLAVIRTHKVDVIAAHLYGSAIYGSLAGRLSGVPVVSVLHGQSDITGKGKFTWLKKMLLRSGSDAVIFVSDRLRLELAATLKIPEAKCLIIANGVDTAKFLPGREDTLRRKMHLQQGDVLVGAVGNIRAPKSYDVFLRAAQLLMARSPKYRFVIAGEGSGALLESLLALRRELGLEEHVNFLGLCSNVVELFHNLDLYVLSSTTEGFSIACIEAMACGVPVVATRSGGPEGIIEDGTSGLLVAAGEPAMLADAIERVAGDNSFANYLSVNALSRVRSNFTIITMLGCYERLFATLAAGEKAQSSRGDG